MPGIRFHPSAQERTSAGFPRARLSVDGLASLAVSPRLLLSVVAFGLSNCYRYYAAEQPRCQEGVHFTGWARQSHRVAEDHLSLPRFGGRCYYRASESVERAGPDRLCWSVPVPRRQSRISCQGASRKDQGSYPQISQLHAEDGRQRGISCQGAKTQGHGHHKDDRRPMATAGRAHHRRCPRDGGWPRLWRAAPGRNLAQRRRGVSPCLPICEKPSSSRASYADLSPTQGRERLGGTPRQNLAQGATPPGRGSFTGCPADRFALRWFLFYTVGGQDRSP